MANIFLLISDIALREAITEQIKAATLGESSTIDMSQALIKQLNGCDRNSVVIIDDDAPDKETELLIEALNERDEKPVILLIGHAEKEKITETFIKPLRLGHLITRLRYYLETAPLLREPVVCFGPYRLESQNRRLIYEKSGSSIKLTEKETALLVFLAHCREAATRRDILASVWGYDERIDTHTLETHIYQLRRKLDTDGHGENWLVNESGAYRLVQEKNNA